MKVIICGAGEVGLHLAVYLSQEGDDVVVVDQDSALVRKIESAADIRGVVGHASSPDVLEECGIQEADIIIAVTYMDEINMIICQIAHSIFHVPMKIARIRKRDYLNPMWASLYSQEHLPVDVIISPEVETATVISQHLRLPGASSVIPFAQGMLCMLGIRCYENCVALNTPLENLSLLFPHLDLFILVLLRDGNVIIPSGDTQLLQGDELFFIVKSENLHEAMQAFGHEPIENHRILIQGGGEVGRFVAHEALSYGVDRIKFIEIDKEKAAALALEFADYDVTVIQGDILDNEILQEANIADIETVVAVSSSDTNNILAALLAKRYGAKKAIALINNSGYRQLVSSLGIDTVIVPRSITFSSILRHIRRGRILSVHIIGDRAGEVIEVEICENSPMVAVAIKDMKLPGDTSLAIVVRGEEMLHPKKDIILTVGDKLILFAPHQKVREVGKQFSANSKWY